MRPLRELLARLRATLRGRATDAEMDEEMRFHVEMHARRDIAAGMPPDEARRVALVAFGGRERFKEEARDESRHRWFEDLGVDVRYGLRMLRRTPAFTAIAVLSLALGIGANTAVFSVVNAVLLRPLPLPEPDRLVSVLLRHEGMPRRGGLSVADVEGIQSGATSLERFGVYYHDPAGITLTGRGEAEQIVGTWTSSGLLATLGVRPMLGRLPLEQEGRPGGDRVVVLSHGFWRDRMDAAPSAIGETLLLDGNAHTIIGVMPQGFAVPGIPDDVLWPVLQPEPPEARLPFWLWGIGRLASGQTPASAAAQLASVAAAVKADYPASPPQWRYDVADLKSTLVEDARTTVLVLYGAVTLILLMAAANVANLFLARAAARLPELAIRSALGAGRQRLVRQLVTESTLAALLGAALGLLLARGLLGGLGRVLPTGLPRGTEVTLDPTVLLVTVVVALVTGVAVGLVPALNVPSDALAAGLREGGRGGSGGGTRRRRVREALVVAEFALALAVLVGAGLVVNSLMRLQRVDSGARAEHLLMARISVPPARYPQPQQLETFFDEIMSRLRALPGVADVSASMAVPPNRLVMRNPFTPEGSPPTPGEAPPLAEELLVTPDYFRAFAIPVRGRAFTDADRVDAPPVAIVNETMARRYFPDGQAVGRWIQTGQPSPDNTRLSIVGVVPDVKYQGLDAEPEPTIYVPFKQNRWWRSMYLTVRVQCVGQGSDCDPRSQARAIRATVAALDPQVPIQEIRTMDELLAESVATPRFRALLLGSFGLIALLLASAGIYGVMSYTVTQRRRETGVRLALGASPGSIVRLVVTDGMRLAALGVALGILAALAGTRLLGGVLYAVSPLDPTTFAAMTLFLAAVGLAACAIPALRASRLDPMLAIREE